MQSNNIITIADSRLEEYVELMQEIESLDKRKEELKVLILSLMNTDGLQQIKNDKATFSIAATVKYKYSDTVNTSEEYLKGLKQTERENGTAEKTETPCLRVQLI